MGEPLAQSVALCKAALACQIAPKGHSRAAAEDTKTPKIRKRRSLRMVVVGQGGRPGGVLAFAPAHTRGPLQRSGLPVVEPGQQPPGGVRTRRLGRALGLAGRQRPVAHQTLARRRGLADVVRLASGRPALRHRRQPRPVLPLCESPSRRILEHRLEPRPPVLVIFFSTATKSISFPTLL